ncbi:MAG: apolipoprotein N-acyltransferase [Polyangiales bacterium]
MKRSEKSSASTEGSEPSPSIPKGPEAPISRSRRWFHVLLVVIGGALEFLGFAGFGYWPLVFFAFVPMMYVLDREQGASTKRVLALGLIHGTVTVAGGYHWLVDMLATFSGYDGFMNWFFASAFFVYQGVNHAVMYWLYRRAVRNGFDKSLAAIAALVAIECLYPVLFPSFIGTGLHVMPWLIQIVDLGGPMLLSAIVMLINATIYAVACATRTKEWPKRTIAACLASVLFVVAYGAYRVGEVDARAASAETVNVGLVQVNMGIFAKREEPYEGHRRHLQQSVQLQRENDLDLLVWPESAYTFFVPEGMTNLRNRVLPGIEVPVIFGGLSRRRDGEESHHYNTAFLADENGDIAGTYDKTFLLAFGEYLPLGDTFPILYEWSPNTGHFTHGDHVRPLIQDNMRISMLVCYEDVLPGFTRHAVQEANPNLLVNITNDAWFGDTQEPWIHLALAKFRAVEHHRALVRSTNSGVTAFVDAAGRTLDTIPFGERDEIVAELPLLDDNTLYSVLGDWPGWLCVIGIALMAFRRRKSKSKGADSKATSETDAA